jgi:hypothetical protein
MELTLTLIVLHYSCLDSSLNAYFMHNYYRPGEEYNQ